MYGGVKNAYSDSGNWWILCIFWCCNLQLGMAGVSPKEEQASSIKTVLEAHSFLANSA